MKNRGNILVVEWDEEGKELFEIRIAWKDSEDLTVNAMEAKGRAKLLRTLRSICKLEGLAFPKSGHARN